MIRVHKLTKLYDGVPPSLFEVSLEIDRGEFVFITILSGAGNVSATFLGALVFELIRTYAFEYAPHIWQLILGGTLLAIIMFPPDGLWSLVDRWRKARA